MGYKRASAKDILAISGLLTQHFDRDQKQYRDGWSDEKVAKSVNGTRHLVERVRNELGLGIRSKGFGAFVARMENMEAELAALKDRVLELETRPQL